MVVQGLTSVNAYSRFINFFYMITPAFRSHNFQAETRKITRWMMYFKNFLKSSRGNRKRSPESHTIEYIRKTIIYDLIHRKVCKVQTNGPEFNVKKVTFGCFCRKVCWGHSYRKVSQRGIKIYLQQETTMNLKILSRTQIPRLQIPRLFFISLTLRITPIKHKKRMIEKFDNRTAIPHSKNYKVTKTIRRQTHEMLLDTILELYNARKFAKWV